MLNFRPEKIPLDILPTLLESLSDRRDWHACALVNWAFNVAATPLLYRTLDSKIISQARGMDRVLHPAPTLLSRPEVAQYVRHITETGAVLNNHPRIASAAVSAIALCKNLESFNWLDDSPSNRASAALLALIEVIRLHSLKGITIRSRIDLGEPAWQRLNSLRGLRSIAIWCMEGPPRVLQGWADKLGSTLTQLDLGRCAGVPPTILISVLSQLPMLQFLRLNGAPSAAIPALLTHLPNLRALDTEYLGSGNYRGLTKPLPSLKSLVVRTMSMQLDGHQQLWMWILELATQPRASLESFTLSAFSVQGQIMLPRGFVMAMARMHGETLRSWMVGLTQLTLEDVQYVCMAFPALEELVCSVASHDAASIGRALAGAQCLRKVKLHVHWMPDENYTYRPTTNPLAPDVHRTSAADTVLARFTSDDAHEMMIRSGGSLRHICVGSVLFTGKWALRDGSLQFQVMQELTERIAVFSR